MIEVSVILLVSLVAGSLYVGARLMTQRERKNVAAEMARLHQSLAWHEQRLRLAKQKNWDYEMINRITEQLEETRFQLAQLSTAQAAAPEAR